MDRPLGWFHCSQQPWRELYVGGKKEVASPTGLSGVRCKALMSKSWNDLSAEMEKMIKKMQRAGTSEAEIQRFRESTEQEIQETIARIIARKEGLEPESPPESMEPTHSLAFSREGRWLLRGGDRAMCVYDWARVPREAGAELVDPTCGNRIARRPE